MREFSPRIAALRGPPGLALAALLLATGALIADSSNGDASADGAARPAGDQVAALDLARWIRDRRPEIRLVDVRSPAEFEEYHIATAVNLPFTDIAARTLAGASAIVVYDESGERGGEAERASRVLSRAERMDVRVLSGGLVAWTSEVLRPTIAADATPAERARFEETAALSRWFDGVPRTVPAGTGPAKVAGDAGRTARESRATRRQGC